MNSKIEYIKDIIKQHPNINDLYTGEVYDLSNFKNVNYPLIFIELNDADLNLNEIINNYKIIYIDRILNDKSDAFEIQLDANYIINDIINALSETYSFSTPVTTIPFNQQISDMCAGAYIDIKIEECGLGAGITVSFTPSEPNQLPSEYVSHSGTTLKSYLDNLEIQSINNLTSLESSISTESSIREYNDEQILIVIPLEYSALTYNIQYSDKNKCLLYNNSISGSTIIPSDSTINFPIGTVITFCQKGNGQIVISGEGGVTIQGSYKSASINKFLQIWKVESNNWYVIGGTD